MASVPTSQPSSNISTPPRDVSEWDGPRLDTMEFYHGPAEDDGVNPGRFGEAPETITNDACSSRSVTVDLSSESSIFTHNTQASAPWSKMDLDIL